MHDEKAMKTGGIIFSVTQNLTCELPQFLRDFSDYACKLKRQTDEGGSWESMVLEVGGSDRPASPTIYSLPIALILQINLRIGFVITLSWLFYYHCCGKTTVFSGSVLHAQSL